MRAVLPLLLLALAAPPAAPAEFDPFAGGKPLAVLIESDPWNGVIGSDTPRAAVYQDGLVVLWSAKKRDYVSKRLSRAELAALRAKLASLGDAKALRKDYRVLGPTDRPTTRLFLDLDGAPKGVSVYDLNDAGRAPLEDKADGTALRLVKSARDLLAGLSYPDAAAWTPPYVEVMLWPFQEATGKAVPWPRDWPGLDSPRARNRHGESYSIFLSPGALGELRSLSERLDRQNAALDLGGRKWALAYRPVFPGEPVWRDAF